MRFLASNIIFIRFLQNILDSIEKLSYISHAIPFRCFDLNDIYLTERALYHFGIHIRYCKVYSNAIAHNKSNIVMFINYPNQIYTQCCRMFTFCCCCCCFFLLSHTTTHKASQLAVETRTTINWINKQRSRKPIGVAHTAKGIKYKKLLRIFIDWLVQSIYIYFVFLLYSILSLIAEIATFCVSLVELLPYCNWQNAQSEMIISLAAWFSSYFVCLYIRGKRAHS